MHFFQYICSQLSQSPGFTFTGSTNHGSITVLQFMTGNPGCGGQLYALLYAILYKVIGHPWIFISVEVLEPIPHGYWGVTVVNFKGVSKNYTWISTAQVSTTNPRISLTTSSYLYYSFYIKEKLPFRVLFCLPPKSLICVPSYVV